MITTDSDKVSKVKKLTQLTNSLRSHILGYSEFFELKNLLSELGIITDKEFDELLAKYGYPDSDTLYSKIKNYMVAESIDKSKVSNFIGNVSGGTMNRQIKLINEIKRSR